MVTFLSTTSKVSKKAGIGIAGLIGLSLLVSSCSAPSTEAKPEETSPETSISESATATETATDTPAEATDISADTANPVAIAGKVIETDKGSYRQIALNPDFKVKPEMVYENVATTYSQEDVDAASKAMIDYILRYFIDPPVIDRESSVEAWSETIKGDLNSESFTHFFDGVGTVNAETGRGSSPFNANNHWADTNYKGFSYVYNADETRIKNLDLRVASVYVVEDTTALALEANVTYQMPATYLSTLQGQPSADGKPYKAIQHTSGTVTLAVAKDASGKWIINAYQADFDNPTEDDVK